MLQRNSGHDHRHCHPDPIRGEPPVEIVPPVAPVHRVANADAAAHAPEGALRRAVGPSGVWHKKITMIYQKKSHQFAGPAKSITPHELSTLQNKYFFLIKAFFMGKMAFLGEFSTLQFPCPWWGSWSLGSRCGPGWCPLSRLQQVNSHNIVGFLKNQFSYWIRLSIWRKRTQETARSSPSYPSCRGPG